MAYTQGDKVRVSNEFTLSGAAADPTTVKVTIVRPNGVRNTYTYLTDAGVVKASTGNYYYDVSAVIPGTWTYFWHSEGTGQAADEKTFIVEAALGADAPGPPRDLGVTYGELQRYVGRELGAGRDPGTWQPDEREDAGDFIRAGYRRFLWHEPVVTSSLQGKDGQFQKLKQSVAEPWSFLEATKPLTLVAGETDYQLPEDFGEMLKDDGFIYATDQQRIALVSHEHILQMRSKQTASGPAKYASISAIDAQTNRQQASFYPTPAENATVYFTYVIAPKELNENNPIPLGGPQHAETIIEACLAAVEKFNHGTEGVHEKKFQECLARSIQCDANLSQTIDPWPLEDKANSLDINKAYLKRLIGKQLEFGAHSATWDFSQASVVDLVLEMGLRKMYWPPVLPGEKFAHQWKYLKPVKPLTTAVGISNYDLPSGFVRMEGPITFEPDEGGPPLEIVREYQIRQMLTRSTSVGRPRYAAVVAKPIDPAGGTTYELVCWPPADDVYAWSFRCQLSPFMMAAEVTLPYGGQQHAQTLIHACLAAAEEQMKIVNGPHAVKFMECLMASVGSDRMTDCPEYLGVNRDRSNDYSDEDSLTDDYHHRSDNLVEYLGPL